MDKFEIVLITLTNRIQGNKESYKSFSGVIRKQYEGEKLKLQLSTLQDLEGHFNTGKHGW